MTMAQYDKAIKMLHKNGLDWYVVLYDDGKLKLMHETSLSNILQCGHDKEDYGISAMYRCGARNKAEAKEWLGEI